MFNFNVSIPTEIVFGAGEWEKTGDLMHQHADKVLLLYGSERIFQSGLGPKLVASLEDACCEVVRCGGVSSNPDSAFIDEVIKCARAQKINGILAVGGGSVIDAAKAVALGVCATQNIMECINGGVVDSCVPPIGVVVTMPASGSEANEVLVVTDHASGVKRMGAFPALKPKFAILDPSLTCSIPENQTAYGGVDIFAHSFERYFDTTRNSSLFDELSLGIMKTVVRILPQVLADPNNVDLRGELMMAATMSHSNMIGPGGDFACHEISHEVTHVYGLAHGDALARIMPAWCSAMEEKDPARFHHFYKEVFDAEPEEGVKAFRSFIQSVGLSTKLASTKEEGEQLLAALHAGPPLGRGKLALDAQDLQATYEKML